MCIITSIEIYSALNPAFRKHKWAKEQLLEKLKIVVTCNHKKRMVGLLLNLESWNVGLTSEAVDKLTVSSVVKSVQSSIVKAEFIYQETIKFGQTIKP